MVVILSYLEASCIITMERLFRKIQEPEELTTGIKTMGMAQQIIHTYQ